MSTGPGRGTLLELIPSIGASTSLPCLGGMHLVPIDEMSSIIFIGLLHFLRLRLTTLARDDPSCTGAEMLAVLPRDRAVDKYHLDTFGKLTWTFEARRILDGFRIEDDDVRIISGFQRSPLGEVEILCGQASHFPDGGF